MRLLQQSSVGAKLALGFGGILAFLVAVAVFAIFQLMHISDRAQEIADEHLSGVRDALLISESATRYRVREYRLAMTQPEDVDKVVKRLAQAIEAVDQHRKSYESSLSSAQDRELYSAFEQSWQAYLATSQRLQATLKGGDSAAAMTILTTDSLKGFDAVVAALKAMSEYNDQAAQQAKDEGAAQAVQARLMIVLAVLAALGAGVLLSWAIARSVTRPLKAALNLAEAVAGGDLTHELQADGNDELAQLTRALSRMVGQLRGLVTEVRVGVQAVSNASSEIAVGSRELSSRTEQAAASLEETAASMDELSSTMSQAADTAQQANQLASCATASAQRGGDVVARVVDNMGQITEASRKIADIIGVIDGIAFQTNILALNAAVEAARAGEQGRGFAVVASEVRTLAQRSAQAAKEIKGLITASTDTVESGAQLVNEAGSVMQELVSSVQRVTDLMGELAAASSEQKSGISQVNTAVTHLDQVTQKNAALVQDTASAAATMSGQASHLQDVVAMFRIGDESVASRPARPVEALASAAPKPAPASVTPRPGPVARAPRPEVATTAVAAPKTPPTGPIARPVTTPVARPVARPASVPTPVPRHAPAAVASAAASDDDWETF